MMNNNQDITKPTNRIRTIVLCAFAFIILSGLMVLNEYFGFGNTQRREQREQRILERVCLLNNQIHKIKTTRRELEESQREAAQILQKIIDRQAHYETADHHHPHAEQQLADLAHLRKQAEELQRQLGQMLADSDQQLAKCEKTLQEFVD